MNWIKELNRFINEIPTHLRDCDITISPEIYEGVIENLDTGMYRGHRIFTSNIISKETMVTGSLYM